MRHRIHLPVGNWPCDGTSARLPDQVGVHTHRRNSVAEDLQRLQTDPHGPDRPLAQPQQGALPGRHEGRRAQPP